MGLHDTEKPNKVKADLIVFLIIILIGLGVYLFLNTVFPISDSLI